VQSRGRRQFIAGVAALVLVAVGVGVVVVATRGGNSPSTARGRTATDFSARFAGFKPAPEPNGKLAKVVWPDFVTRAGPEVKRLYEFQITHGELMRYMPCFCGCGQFAHHRSNRDCYVKQVNPDGSVVLDSMAPT
jgi:Protein of unknown function with PCYCGC motif